MEGQYPDWWKKEGAVTTNTQKTKSTANIATANSTAGSSSGDGKFYALITDTNPANMTRQIIIFANSACSNHCFIDKADFVTSDPFMIKMAIWLQREASLR